MIATRTAGISEPLDEPKPSPALSNIQATQKRPVSQPSRPPQLQAQDQRLARRKQLQKPKIMICGGGGTIAAAPPATTSRPLNSKKTIQSDDEDLWAAIAAPPPTTRAKPLSSGRGRGAKKSISR